ncbi:MAG: hypothetical protein EOO75_18475 [Myxococcales bacterium]|nr:MAG: hypothetical protein EOO75_18475 [Myxococcales bacterium]
MRAARPAPTGAWLRVSGRLALALLCGCGQEQAAREQAERVSRAIDALVAADARARAAPLAVLRDTACTLPDVCAARQACVDAFAPQVEAAARQREARALLDRHDPSLTPQIDVKLDEAERLQGQARSLQDGCLAAATAMRQAHRL